MELDKLRYFKRIAELENISRVAKEVNIAQSALSRMLKSLEDEFDAPLFDRRGKNIYLNENGRILLSYVDRILDPLDACKDEIALKSGQVSNTVSISMLAATRLLPNMVIGFRNAYPEYKIVLTKSLVNSLTSNPWDLIIHASDELAVEYPSEVLFEEDCYIASSSEHRFAAMEAIDPRELITEKFLMLDRNQSLADLISEEELNADYIIPKAFDPRVKDAVAKAVAKAARESGVGRA